MSEVFRDVFFTYLSEHSPCEDPFYLWGPQTDPSAANCESELLLKLFILLCFSLSWEIEIVLKQVSKYLFFFNGQVKLSP